MERKNVIFLTVVAIATLLVAVVGATFAYFSTTVQSQITNNSNQATVKTAQLTASTIIFAQSGNKINLENAIPGDTASTSFTIQNTGETAIPYNIQWKDVTNTFNNANELITDGSAPETGKTMADDLVYTMICTGGTSQTKSETTAPLNDQDSNATILGNVTVAAGQTATCELTVTFKETDRNQNYNQGKSFQGTVEVTTEKITAANK